VNLRKDHCRNLQQQNDQRTCLSLAWADPLSRRGTAHGTLTNPGADCAKEQQLNMRAYAAFGNPGAVSEPLLNNKRLSATDISALASMKNVAKCDTWCELQNPVNHRVFERKLRPRPLAEGTSAWASRIASPPHYHELSGKEDGFPCLTGLGWPQFGAKSIVLLRR
jgi:hypothetical protein